MSGPTPERNHVTMDALRMSIVAFLATWMLLRNNVCSSREVPFSITQESTSRSLRTFPHQAYWNGLEPSCGVRISYGLADVQVKFAFAMSVICILNLFRNSKIFRSQTSYWYNNPELAKCMVHFFESLSSFRSSNRCRYCEVRLLATIFGKVQFEILDRDLFATYQLLYIF